MRKIAIVSVLGVYATAGFGDRVLAQSITLDGTLGSAGTLNGPTYIIPQAAGQTVDNNLFHSFGQFGLNTGETAIFDSAANISNILSRVTGGQASFIDGLIFTRSASVNLFLINPSGIVFGPNASLDIGGTTRGSFVATTADAISWSNGGQFSATNPGGASSLLTLVGDPSGFIGSLTPLEPIRSEGTLSVYPSQSLLLLGGNVELSGAILSAPGGRVELGALNGAGTVALNSDGSLSFPEGVALSNVSLSNSRIFTSVDQGAIGNADDVRITANSVSLTDGTQIFSGSLGQGDSGVVSIQATEAVTLDNSGIFSGIWSQAEGTGGDINILAGSLSLTNGARLVTGILGSTDTLTGGRGQAGDVNVTVRDAVIINGVNAEGFASAIFSDVGQGAIGNAGDVKITANSVSLADGARIISASYGQGDSGVVSIQATAAVTLDNSPIFSGLWSQAQGTGGEINILAGSLSLTNDAQISSGSLGQGDSGVVSIQATAAVTLDNSDIFSYIGSQAQGTAGEINILAGSLSLTNGSQLVSSIRGSGGSNRAGNVNVTVRDDVIINGANAEGIASAIFSDVGQGAIGNAGDVTITANSVSLTDSARIIAASLGQGDSGVVSIQATEAVTLDNSYIRSDIGSQAEGTAGEINILAGSLSLTNGAELQTATTGRGDAGNIFLQANDSISLSDSFISTIVDRGAIGNAGDVTITANSVSLTDDTQIISGSLGQGDSGGVSIQATAAVTLDNSNILSNLESQTEGTGGEINILAGSLSLTNGAQLQTVTSSRGDAGNIFLQANDSIFLSNSIVSSRVDQGAMGNAGDVRITANSVSLTDGTQISANTSGEGDAGLITIQALETVLLSGENTAIFSSVDGTGIGNAPGVLISASSVSLTDGAGIIAASLGQGDSGVVSIQATAAVTLDNSDIFSYIGSQVQGTAGEINILAGSLSLTNGSQLVSSILGSADTLTSGSSQAGDVNVTVRDAVIINGVNAEGTASKIFSSVEQGAIGNAGDVRITANSVSLTDGAQISSASSGQGDSGIVSIQATEAVTLDNSAILSDIGSQAEGTAGEINILTGSLSLTNGAQLVTVTRGRGGAGLISIDANNISVSGVNPNTQFRSGIFSTVEPGAVNNPVSSNDTVASGVLINTESLSLSDGARIAVNTFGNGNAGEVAIAASGDVFVTGGSSISSNVGGTGRGAAGGVEILANSVFVNDGAQLSSSTFGIGNAGSVVIQAVDISLANGNIFTNVEFGAEGAGGSVFIDTNLLFLTDGAVISANTAGLGNAGNVTVLAKDAITLTDSGTGINTSVTPTAQGTGGSIDLRSPTISVTDNAGVSVASLGQGNGGNLSIQSQKVSLDDGGAITATTANGEGGNVNLQAQDLVLLRRNSNISATAGNNANGGNINIDTKFIVAPGIENSDITANAVEGQGGDIDITAEGIFGIQSRSEQTPFSDITASSELGIDGTVELNTPDIDRSQGLVALPVDTVDASSQINAECTNGNNVAKNKLTVTGRGGLPPNPGDTLSNEEVLANWATLEEVAVKNPQTASTNFSQKNSPTQQIVEAQGWVIDSQGKVTLTAQAPMVTPSSNRFSTSACQQS